MSRVAKRRLGDIAVVLISAVLTLGLALMAHQVGDQSQQLDVQGQQLDVQSQQLEVLEQALGDEQSNVEELGGEPVAPPPDELLEDPEYTPSPGPAGPSGPPGPALSDAEIQAAFAVYFAEHPYQFEPSAAELTAAFASILADHPDLLDQQLYAAMAAYLAEHPAPAGPPGPAGADGADGADGQDGATGEPGRPPTQEEIQAAVEAYMAEHPLPARCPEGSDWVAATLVTLDGPPLESVVCAAA